MSIGDRVDVALRPIATVLCFLALPSQVPRKWKSSICRG